MEEAVLRGQQRADHFLKSQQRISSFWLLVLLRSGQASGCTVRTQYETLNLTSTGFCTRFKREGWLCSPTPVPRKDKHMMGATAAVPPSFVKATLTAAKPKLFTVSPPG